MLTISFNFFVVYPLVMYAVSRYDEFKVRYSFKSEDLPSIWTLCWQLPFCVYLEDIGFSIAHRQLHSQFLYKNVHKVHHTYIEPIGISAAYTHPIEFCIGNILPAILPVFLLGNKMHIVTIYIWSILRLAATVNGHSGYDFPWVPWDLMPMRGTPTYHDFHHSGGDFSGNFSGQTTVMDTIWGTNLKYFAKNKDPNKLK